MSLADRIANTKPVQYGPPCGMSVLLAKLTNQDREVLEDILSENTQTNNISNRQLHQILIEEGHNVAFNSVALHRRRQCRCFTGLRAKVSK